MNDNNLFKSLLNKIIFTDYEPLEILLKRENNKSAEEFINKIKKDYPNS